MNNVLRIYSKSSTHVPGKRRHQRDLRARVSRCGKRVPRLAGLPHASRSEVEGRKMGRLERQPRLGAAARNRSRGALLGPARRDIRAGTSSSAPQGATATLEQVPDSSALFERSGDARRSCRGPPGVPRGGRVEGATLMLIGPSLLLGLVRVLGFLDWSVFLAGLLFA